MRTARCVMPLSLFSPEAFLPERVAAALPGRYHLLSEGGVREVVCDYFDSYDRRLLGRGITLIREREEGVNRHFVIGGGCVREVPWRDSADEAECGSWLGDGKRARHLADHIAPRKLLARDHTVEARHLYWVKDRREKSVASLELRSLRPAEPVEPGAPAAALHALLLTPLRGYGAEGDKVAAKLQKGLELSSTPFSPLGQWLAQTPDGAEAPPDHWPPEIAADAPAGAAVLQILASLYQGAVVSSRAVVARLDPEALHDLRTTTRRARSVLRPCLGAFESGEGEALLGFLDELATRSSRLRDLDVLLARLPDVWQRIAGWEGELAIRQVLTLLEGERRSEQSALIRYLRTKRFNTGMGLWSELATGDPLSPNIDEGTGQFARHAIGELYDKVIESGRRRERSTPPEVFHQMRKRCKRLRYLIECFRALLPEAAGGEALKVMKGYQDLLGAYQDDDSHRVLLLEFADSWRRKGESRSTLLVLESVAQYLEERIEDEYPRLIKRLQKLGAKHNRRAFDRLLAVAGE